MCTEESSKLRCRLAESRANTSGDRLRATGVRCGAARSGNEARETRDRTGRDQVLPTTGTKIFVRRALFGPAMRSRSANGKFPFRGSRCLDLFAANSSPFARRSLFSLSLQPAIRDQQGRTTVKIIARAHVQDKLLSIGFTIRT